MKFKESHYGETIHILIPGQVESWIKLGSSIELEGDETPEQAWDIVNNKIAAWVKKRKPELETGEAVIEKQVDKLTGDLCTDIESVTDLKVLESYKFLVKGKSSLQTVYDTQFKKLSK